MSRKYYKKQARELDAKLEKECERQIHLTYGSACMALYDQGWRTKRLSDLLDMTYAIWDECSEYSTKKSMLEMLEEETGMEMRLSADGDSYKKYDFLNGKLGLYKPTDIMPYPMWIRMRQGMIKWTGALVQASLYLALHRKHGYGFSRISNLQSLMFEIQNNYPDAEKLREECRKKTGIEIVRERERISDPMQSPEDQYFEMSAAEAVRQISQKKCC